jgi:hypothetical protein
VRWLVVFRFFIKLKKKLLSLNKIKNALIITVLGSQTALGFATTVIFTYF